MAYNSIEEVIADERFLAWYFQSNETLAKEWAMQMAANAQYKQLTEQSAAWLKQHLINEKNLPEQQIAAAQQRLQQNIIQAPIVAIKAKKTSWWLPAAAAVLLLVAGLGYWQYKAHHQTTLGTAYGSINSYKLPDGSQVTLNANSQISMNDTWSRLGVREVWLKGEAYFKVQKTAHKTPFIVHADKMDIVVTGTQFNVVNRLNETSVLLTEGSVTVKMPNGNEMQMKPGDFVKAQKDVPQKVPANEEKVLAWRQARLVFDNTSMKEVGQMIEDYYGVKVKFADAAVAEKRLAAGVMPNDNLDVLIQSLEATGEFKIQKQNKEIIISFP